MWQQWRSFALTTLMSFVKTVCAASSARLLSSTATTRYVCVFACVCVCVCMNIYICVYIYIYICIYVREYTCIYIYTPLQAVCPCYGVATISRLLEFIGLFCKKALYKRLYSTKETYNLRSLLIVATPYLRPQLHGTWIHVYTHTYQYIESGMCAYVYVYL